MVHYWGEKRQKRGSIEYKTKFSYWLTVVSPFLSFSLFIDQISVQLLIFTVTPILYLFAVAVLGQALTPSTFLTTIDQDRLKKVFKSTTPYTDLPTVHYSILGLKLLGDTSINNQVSCMFVVILLYKQHSKSKNVKGT